MAFDNSASLSSRVLIGQLKGSHQNVVKKTSQSCQLIKNFAGWPLALDALGTRLAVGKGQSHDYFVYLCYKFAKFISKELANAYIAFRLLRKQNQMILLPNMLFIVA